MSDSVRPHRQQPTRLSRPWDSPGKNTGVGCHFLLQCMQVKSESEVTQSCLTLSDPMDCSLTGSSVHGIFQARVLEWGAITFSDVCISILYWCFSSWLTSWCRISSSFIHLIRTDSNAFFNSWVIFHFVYVPQLPFPFISQWTSRLLPCPGYCKQCCNEHWGTRVSFNSGFLGVYAQQWDCWVIRQFYFQFFKESPHCSP